jgi:DNA-binding beta-propeller fold protein YncE
MPSPALRIAGRVTGPALAAVPLALALAGSAGGPARAGTTPATPTTPFGYVASSDTHDVIPFPATRITPVITPGGSIPITGSPATLVTAPNNQFVWVASSAGVTPIGTDFRKPGPLIPVPGGAASLVARPDGKRLYAATDTASATVTTVVPIITSARKTSHPVTFAPGPGAHPAALAITPDGKTVYAASSLGTVTPIATATGLPGKPIAFGPKDPAGTAHLAITPDGKTLYAFTSDPRLTVTTVTPISTATGRAGQPVAVGQGPLAVVFSPNGKTAYVASTGDGPAKLVRAKLTPVTVATGRPGPFINVGPPAAALSATDTPDGKQVFLSAIWLGPHRNQVITVAAAAGAIVKEYFVDAPREVAVTPDGTIAYILNAEDNAFGVVQSITIATREIHGGFSVGKVPVALTIVP